MNASHIDAMAALEVICFAEPYSMQTLLNELANPNAYYWVDCLPDGTIRGYAGLNVVLDEGHISNVATAPEYRRLGVADRLIQRHIALAQTLELHALMLEVRESNTPARALYQKHGFVEVGRRPRYYTRPSEDAILMTLLLAVTE